MTPRRPGHPLPRRRRAAGWSRASTSSDLRDAGDPVELAQALRRRGRRRADLPRHLRLPRGPGHHDGDRLAHRRAGVHPAHRRRRRRAASTTSTGCCGPAPTRSRSTPPRSAGPSWSPRSPTGSATRCWCSRSTPAARPGTDSGFEVTTHGGRQQRRARRGRVGRAGRPSSAPARSCSTRWTPTAPRTASTSS